MLIGAIADDLTGATDLALTLSREGMRVVQIVGVPTPDVDMSGFDAVVVALKSRTIPAEEAVALSLASAKALLAAGASQFFFKYCSTFDSTVHGNIGPVIDALLDFLGEHRTIACPAFPANGRTVYGGHLFVGDQLLSESSMRDHPLTPMRDSNLVRVLQAQSNHNVSLLPHSVVASGVGQTAAAIYGDGDVRIVDAISDEDLRIIGTAAADLKLVTGASGIALSLPANFRRKGMLKSRRKFQLLRQSSGRDVILSGSCSAATRRQVEVARSGGVPALQIDPIKLADGSMTVEHAQKFVLSQSVGSTPIVYSSADPASVMQTQRRLGAGAAGTLVEDFMAALARSLAGYGFRRFIVAGGETSGAVVTALGIRGLLIGQEIDPGVPWTQTIGRHDPLTLALKSGNFGANDFFLKAWSLLDDNPGR